MAEREMLLQKRFRIFVLLSVFILALEAFGGIFTNSLALLSDAGHVLIDLLALGLAYFSMMLSGRKATKKFTFGYYRAEILTAIMNGVILILVTVYIFYEAYTRFLSPQYIRTSEMLVIAVIGLFANLYVVIRMQGFDKRNLNIRGAYLHVLSDVISSIGVVLAGVLIIFTGNYAIDPVISAMIGIFILGNSFKLIKDSVHILMEATPSHINIEKLSKEINRIKGVKQIHDLHVWSISSDMYAMSSHILIDSKNRKMSNRIISDINRMVGKKYNITHTVIQSEHDNCVDDSKVNKH